MSENYHANSPSFEPRPGWGGQLMGWLKAHWLTRLMPGLLLLAGLVLLITYYPTSPADTPATANQNAPLAGDPKISLPIVKGDGAVTLTRRALAEYLKLSPATQLTAEQSLYIETVYIKKLATVDLVIGNELDFSITELETTISAALALPESQLVKFRRYIK